MFRLPILLFLLYTLAGCSSAGFFMAEISVHSSEWAEDVYLHIDPSRITIYQNTGPTRPVGDIRLSNKQARAVKRALEQIPATDRHQDYVPAVENPDLMEDRSFMALSLRLAPGDDPVLVEMSNCRLAEVGHLVEMIQHIIAASAGPSSTLVSYLSVVWDPGFSGCKKRFE